jgi:hypothetical protein
MTGNRKKAQNSFPNFFIVGAARSGTTTLYRVLKTHPSIFFPDYLKEPGYFSRDLPGGCRCEAEYLSLFPDYGKYEIVGEASTTYLYSEEAPLLIKAATNSPKILIQLRNPVERAISHYKLLRSKTAEKLSFEAALAKENERIQNNIDARFHYFERGKYYRQVKRYLDTFPRQDILITIYEQFRDGPEEILFEICEFLDVEVSGIDGNIPKANASSETLFPIVNTILSGEYALKKILKRPFSWTTRRKIVKFIRRLNSSSTNISLDISSEIKNDLRNKYLKDVEKLNKIVDEDLRTHWF